VREAATVPGKRGPHFVDPGGQVYEKWLDASRSAARTRRRGGRTPAPFAGWLAVRKVRFFALDLAPFFVGCVHAPNRGLGTVPGPPSDRIRPKQQLSCQDAGGVRARRKAKAGRRPAAARTKRTFGRRRTHNDRLCSRSTARHCVFVSVVPREKRNACAPTLFSRRRGPAFFPSFRRRAWEGVVPLERRPPTTGAPCWWPARKRSTRRKVGRSRGHSGSAGRRLRRRRPLVLGTSFPECVLEGYRQREAVGLRPVGRRSRAPRRRASRGGGGRRGDHGFAANRPPWPRFVRGGFCFGAGKGGKSAPPYGGRG